MNHRLFERTLHRRNPVTLVCQVESLFSTKTPSASNSTVSGQWASASFSEQPVASSSKILACCSERLPIDLISGSVRGVERVMFS